MDIKRVLYENSSRIEYLQRDLEMSMDAIKVISKHYYHSKLTSPNDNSTRKIIA